MRFHDPHHLVQASRIAHEGGEKHRKRLETSQRLSQGSSLWRILAFFPLSIRDRSKPPLRLPTHLEKSTFGSGFRRQQKGELRLLKPGAKAGAQTLKLLEEDPLGIVMFQGVGDKMAHIADPRRPIGSRTEGLDDAFLDSGAAVTDHVRGPPTALEKRQENRVDLVTVPGLAQAQANHFDLLQRQRFAQAQGRYRDPQHNESLLAANVNRKISDAHPLLIEGTLSLL